MAVKLSKEVMEMVQTLLDVRNTLEDVKLDSTHVLSRDSGYIQTATVECIAAIDKALDLIKYDDEEWK